MKDSGYAAVLVLHCFSARVSNRHSSRTIILENDRLFNTNDTGCDMLFLFLIKQSAPSSSCTNVPHINSISCLWKMFVTVQRNICQSYFCLFLMETSVEGWWWYLTPAQKGRVRIPVGAAVFNACNGYRMIDLSMYIFYFHFIFDLFLWGVFHGHDDRSPTNDTLPCVADFEDDWFRLVMCVSWWTI